MRTFYSKNKNIIIITPFLCGSSLLNNSKNELYLESIDYKSFVNSHQNNIAGQYIFYRNPYNRYISWVNKFLFNTSTLKGIIITGKLESLEIHNPYSNDFWKCAAYFLNYIENNRDNLHLENQSSMYESYIKPYSNLPTTWLDVEQDYIKFVSDLCDENLEIINFLNTYSHRSHPYLNNPITPLDVPYVNYVHEGIQKLYSKDYKFFYKNKLIFPMDLEKL